MHPQIQLQRGAEWDWTHLVQPRGGRELEKPVGWGFVCLPRWSPLGIKRAITFPCPRYSLSGEAEIDDLRSHPGCSHQGTFSAEIKEAPATPGWQTASCFLVEGGDGTTWMRLGSKWSECSGDSPEPGQGIKHPPRSTKTLLIPWHCFWPVLMACAHGSHLGTVQGIARARGCDLTGKTTLWHVLKGQGGGNSVDMSHVLVFISRARWVWVSLALLGLVL